MRRRGERVSWNNRARALRRERAKRSGSPRMAQTAPRRIGRRATETCAWGWGSREASHPRA
eukprot:7771258-Alexandrium_andersonii.AAC.1